MIAVFYGAAVLQNVLFAMLVKTACGFEIQKKKLLCCLAALFMALPQYIFILPSKHIPVFIKLPELLLLMFLKAGCFAVVFRQINLKMLYISVLTFILNEGYADLLRLFIADIKTMKLVACLFEAAITASLILYIRHRNAAAAIAASIEMIPRRIYVMILLFLLMFFLFIYVTVVPQLNNISRILILPVTVSISYIIVRIMRISAAEKEHRRISELLTVQLENQVEYYQKINNIYTEFRAFRHDFRNHLLCLRGLLAENEVQRACEYMDEIENMSRPKKKTYDTGNIIVDALLNDKNDKAQQHHAQITFSGYVPTSGITSADLCTIFANALDNAIEACGKDSSDSEKQICIHSDFQQGYFSITITNPVFEAVEIRNGNQVQTSKEDKLMHGFGVANITQTAHRYSGETALSAENGLFTLEVNLWLKPEI